MTATGTPILEEIMRRQRRMLPDVMVSHPVAALERQAAALPPAPSFAEALSPAGQRGGVRVIAEIKRASPSRGLLCPDFDPPALAETYARAGVAAVSCLTETHFFQGDGQHLVQARKHLEALGRPLPFLRKDFIFDPYQVLETRALGASALLLIVAVLDDPLLVCLLSESRQLGLSALVEVHDEDEVERALEAGATLLGINNRDLRTFAVDLQTTLRLRPRIPSSCLVVSESGIHDADALRGLAAAGVDAVLIGEALVSAPPERRMARTGDFVAAGACASHQAAGGPTCR